MGMTIETMRIVRTIQDAAERGYASIRLETVAERKGATSDQSAEIAKSLGFSIFTRGGCEWIQLPSAGKVIRHAKAVLPAEDGDGHGH